MAFLTLIVLVVAFSFFAWSRAFLRLKEHKMSGFAFILWSGLWAGIIIAALVPETSRFVSSALGIKRPVDVLVYGSIIGLLYLVFRLHVKIEENAQHTTKIVRAIAIENAKKRKR